jgi:hypothetical protein
MAKKKAKSSGKGASPKKPSINYTNEFMGRQGSFEQLTAVSKLGASEDVKERNFYRDLSNQIALGVSGGTMYDENKVMTDAERDGIYAHAIDDSDQTAGGIFHDHKKAVIRGIPEKGLAGVIFNTYHSPLEGDKGRDERVKIVDDLVYVGRVNNAYDNGLGKADIPTSDRKVIVNDKTMGSIAAPFVEEGVDNRYKNDKFADKYVSKDTRDALKNALTTVVYNHSSIARTSTGLVENQKAKLFGEKFTDDAKKAKFVGKSLEIDPDERRARKGSHTAYRMGQEESK